jgi:hypothetical protein
MIDSALRSNNSSRSAYPLNTNLLVHNKVPSTGNVALTQVRVIRGFASSLNLLGTGSNIRAFLYLQPYWNAYISKHVTITV